MRKLAEELGCEYITRPDNRHAKAGNLNYALTKTQGEISRVSFLFMPLAYAFLGVIPIRATPPELLYFFLPYYMVQLAVFSWLNYRSRSALLSDIYSLVLTFPLALTVIQVMLNPFSKGFKVTPKGTVSDRFSFNWGLALPLIILFIPTAISFWHNLGTCLVQFHQHATAPEVIQHFKGLGLGWIWSAYNRWNPSPGRVFNSCVRSMRSPVF